jgi:hypothetical protein
MHEFVMVKPKLQCRPKEVGDATDVEHPKAVQAVSIASPREVIWHVITQGLGNSHHVTPCMAHIPDLELEDLILALVGFSLGLASFLFFISFSLPFIMGMFAQNHCILEVCNFFFFYRNSQLIVCLVSQWRV